MIIKKYIPRFLINIYSYIVYIKFIRKNKLNILDDKEILNKIILERKSIARFGDGELKWILGIEQVSFQDGSLELSKRLEEVLRSKDNNILICIPKAFNNVKGYTYKSKCFWCNFIRWHGKDIISYLDLKYNYGDSTFTRWYIEYKDKTNMKKKIKEIMKIWDNRNVVIIEGSQTKTGIGNELLNNCKSIKRIIAPSKNSFDFYNDILNEAKKIDKNNLILIALGPTATILAYDLTKLGYQALDVGHIDIEYEWYIRKAKKKIPIKGKYVNEAGGIMEEEAINDLDYEKSIIAKVGEKNNENI